MPALDRPAPSTRSVGRTAPPTAAVHRHNGRTPGATAQLLLFFFPILYCRFPHHWREREIGEERVCGRCWRGASAEGSRRHRRRAPRPTPAGLPYWGRSKPPFCLSKVCSPRPCRASSAPQSTSRRPPRWERRLRPRAAAAGALGGPRPRAPAIGGDTRYLSARARCAICARTAPSARLEAFWATWLT